MLTSSPAYKLALPRTPRRVSRFTVRTPGGELLAEDVPIGGGSVSASLTSRVSRTATFTAASEWFPVAATDPLSPAHAIVEIRAGIAYPTGEEELFPVFKGRVYEARQDPDGQVTFRADDLAAEVLAASFERPENSRPGASCLAEIERLVLDAYPDAVFGDSDIKDAIVPRLTWDEDRGKACDDIAAVLEGRWFTLGDGSFVVRGFNYLGVSPVGNLRDGPSGTLTAASITVTADGAYNSVVAVSERADQGDPLRVVARNDITTSPFLYGGDFGKRVRHVRAQTALTLSEVQRVARSQLEASSALLRQWQLSSVPDMTREPGDVVSVEWRGIQDIQVIDSITYPLSPTESMRIGARSSITG